VPYRSVNPATGEVVKTYDNHSDAELEAALATAHSIYEAGCSRGPIQQRLEVRIAATKIGGDPTDESVGLGRLCSVSARDDIAAQVERAVKAGATLHYGGSVIEGPGAFFEPTILTDISRDNPAYFEEFFGPVAQIYFVRDDDEIVGLANDSHYGLSGAILSSDVDRAKTLASRIETGSVRINTSSYTAPDLPFVGVKRSGYGRELSEYGIKELVNQKMVHVAEGGSSRWPRFQPLLHTPTPERTSI